MAGGRDAGDFCVSEADFVTVIEQNVRCQRAHRRFEVIYLPRDERCIRAAEKNFCACEMGECRRTVDVIVMPVRKKYIFYILCVKTERVDIIDR